MMLENKERESEQGFVDFDISQPIIKQEKSEIIEIEKSFDFGELAKRFFSNLLIFIGVYLTFFSSLTFFRVYIVNLTNFNSPLTILFAFVIGMLMLFAGSKANDKKAEWKLYLSIPLISFLTGFIFLLFPSDFHGRLFGWFSIIIYPLVLFLFYTYKEFLESQDTKLK